MSVLDRFKQAEQWLLSKNLWAAYLVLSRIGYPKPTDEIETACVSISTEANRANKYVNFYFNPEFMEKLSLMELVGVLLHESFHVLFGHVTSKYGNANPHLWNVACDAVINDLIEKSYDEIKLPEIRVTGEKLIGENCADHTAEYVYDKAIEKAISMGYVASLQTMDDHRAWSRAIKGLPKDRYDDLQKAIKNALQEAYDRGDNVFGNSAGVGEMPIGMERKVKLAKQKLSPHDLMRRMITKFSSKISPQWAPPNKKLMTYYPQLVLPTWEIINKPRVLFALDTSGSIDPKWLNTFVTICINSRNYVNPEFISFDTEAYPWIPGTGVIRGGGGTDTQCIENHAMRMHQYPDHVIVLTDGGFFPAHITKPDRWIYILEGYYSGLMKTYPEIYKSIHQRSEKIFLPQDKA